jgi:MFS family permease
MAMAALTLCVAITIWIAAPRETMAASTTTFGAQMRGIGKVLASSAFWRVAPATAATHAVYLSYQALWAGPWMRDVAGLDRLAVAQGLFLVNATMAVGYPLFGILADRLAARGLSTRHIFAGFVVLFMIAQMPMGLGWTQSPHGFWALFGLTGCGTILGYAVVTRSFPKEMAGRVGATINMLVFALAFVVQTGIGIVLGQFPAALSAGHQTAMLGLIACQAVAWLWLVWPRARPGALASGA